MLSIAVMIWHSFFLGESLGNSTGETGSVGTNCHSLGFTMNCGDKDPLSLDKKKKQSSPTRNSFSDQASTPSRDEYKPSRKRAALG
jgi:hypothetical protein